MADDDSDFNDILEGTVDEVKDRIKNLDTPDYEGLLSAEEDGKDRKTVKEFLQSKIGSDEEEETDDSESETVDVEEPGKVVEDIERETEGGILGSFSKTSVLAGGLILGIVLGFAAAGFSSGPSAEANPNAVQQSVKKLATAGNFNGTVDVSEPEIRHSMYYFNVTMAQDTGNRTVTQSQEVYVTLDGRYMFLVRKQFGQMISPIDLPQALQRMEQQQSGNQTGTPQTNATQ